jgi:hypothetical protein
MFNGRYISIDRIVERFYTDYGIQDQVDWMVFVEWISECMGLMGVPVGYIDKVATLEVEEHRVQLPCDYYMYSGIRMYNSKTTLRETTDTFEYSTNTTASPLESTMLDGTYDINNNYIHTSFEEGTIELAYKAVPTDERGLPMIPEDDKVVRMLISYLGYKNGMKMFLRNQIDERRYRILEQEYYFNVGAARCKLLTPSVDRMETIKNSFLRLIPKINEHATGFKTLGQQEQRNIY